MATTADPNTTYFQVLKQALRNSNYSDEERRNLWAQAATALPQPSANNISMAHVPRSMSRYSTAISPNVTADAMGRTHSAPVPVPAAMARAASSVSLRFDQASDYSFDSRSASIRNQSSLQPISDYSLYSPSASIRKQPSLQLIDETSAFNSSNLIEYEPADYINVCIEPSGSSLPLPSNANTQKLHLDPLMQDPQWYPSLDGSISPSIPSVGVTTPATNSSSMSRSTSYNPQFFDAVSMLRVQSDSSSSASQPIIPEDGCFISFPFNVDANNISACADTSPFSNFVGSSNEGFSFPSHGSSVSTLEPSQQQSDLAEDMRRSASISSDDSSYASASSTSPRQSRRDREINAHASRKIAPKTEHHDQTRSASSNVQMKRLVSADGSSKDVASITKVPYIRPQHPRIKCQYCNTRPEGFRGTHELERHVARAHATVRKGYICVDYSDDQKFLAGCKHCRNKKVYGAYYNAAAHLRRAHFHPRKRGRKGKTDEKRGGIGGGDHPAMDYLKQHWIKEIEVEGDVKHYNRSATENCSTSFSDAGADECNDAEAFDYEYMNPSFPQPQADLNMPEYSPTMEQGVFMANDGSYEHLSQFAAFPELMPPSSNSNFEFDAYMGQ